MSVPASHLPSLRGSGEYHWYARFTVLPDQPPVLASCGLSLRSGSPREAAERRSRATVLYADERCALSRFPSFFGGECCEVTVRYDDLSTRPEWGTPPDEDVTYRLRHPSPDRMWVNEAVLRPIVDAFLKEAAGDACSA